MLKIRLTRTGKTNSPSYRIVVDNQRSKRDGEVLEYLGTYDPKTSPATVKLNNDLTEKWLKDGAQPTDTVKRFLVNAGLMAKPKKTELKKFTDKPGKKSVERAQIKADKAKSAK